MQCCRQNGDHSWATNYRQAIVNISSLNSWWLATQKQSSFFVVWINASYGMWPLKLPHARYSRFSDSQLLDKLAKRHGLPGHYMMTDNRSLPNHIKHLLICIICYFCNEVVPHGNVSHYTCWYTNHQHTYHQNRYIYGNIAYIKQKHRWTILVLAHLISFLHDVDYHAVLYIPMLDAAVHKILRSFISLSVEESRII